MRLIINCDGGSRGNPGPAAAGIVVRDENEKVLERKGLFIGRATNNVAEYRSLIAALEAAMKYNPDEVKVVMDSELVVKQMNGIYRVKNARLKPLFEKARHLSEKIGKVAFENVPRSDSFQAEADRMVNETLDRNAR